MFFLYYVCVILWQKIIVSNGYTHKHVEQEKGGQEKLTGISQKPREYNFDNV